MPARPPRYLLLALAVLPLLAVGAATVAGDALHSPRPSPQRSAAASQSPAGPSATAPTASASSAPTVPADSTPPQLDVPAAVTVSSMRGPVTVTGTAVGATEVLVDGRPATLDGEHFSAAVPGVPAGLLVTARDSAGNWTAAPVSVTVRLPMMRGVHMTAIGWAYTPLRNPVLQLIREKKINTVELDIKDEDGHIGYASAVPLARQIGATRYATYDAATVIAQLHAMGVRVVGRIVAFRDPTLAAWAWSHGHRDWVVTTPSGTPWAGSYGAISFTNPASAAVRQYNIDLAVEAAKLGFDDIMYDYVRRPDGPISQMRFAGLHGPISSQIVDFVRDSVGPVHEAGAFLAAAVFGISASRPDAVAQPIDALARYVDYVAPMVYPSHWGPGEYGVANPNGQPYAIVSRSLRDFLSQVRGTTAQVVPWLQDFSLGVTYGDAQVRAQIKAAADDGIGSFLLWDAGCRYHPGALAPIG